VTRVVVIGGGINGAGISWELVRRGYTVTLFDKGRFGGATSSATSKLIHGGLRYLEHLQFHLVRESLRNRAYLLEHAPDLVHPLEFVLPVYRGVSRSPWVIRIGLLLYDVLAGRDPLPNHRRLSASAVLKYAPLRQQGLRAGFRFFDAQVDDAALVQRVVLAAQRDGLDGREGTAVQTIQRSGSTWTINGETFDAAVIAVGPWMNEFLARHHLSTRYKLTLVRGSHIFLRRPAPPVGFLLQSPDDRRVFFVLPWKGVTMVGTTEALHTGSPDQVRATAEEVEYLVKRYNLYFENTITSADVTHTTAGVRPLIGGGKQLGNVSRDYKLEVEGTLIKVFGGKMTTFLSLSKKVADRVDRSLGSRRSAKPPVFGER
jgi:glycerol-3-phosphate dehydrogenase